MTLQPERVEVFGSLRSTPRELRDAAAVLGAMNPPPKAVQQAAETLWLAGMTRHSGASQQTIMRSVMALVFAVFDHPDTERAPDDAALAAHGHLAAYMKAILQAKPAGSPGKGELRS